MAVPLASDIEVMDTFCRRFFGKNGVWRRNFLAIHDVARKITFKIYNNVYYKAMDDIDLKIIGLLALDAKRSLADIGGSVGLSPSSVNERIRRLTASGAIRQFTVDLDPAAMGVQTLVFVWIALREDADEAAFRDYAARHPLILECHHVTGAWAYLVKLRVGAPPEIEGFLAELKAHRYLGRSETVIALSSPVPGPFVPKES